MDPLISLALMPTTNKLQRVYSRDHSLLWIIRRIAEDTTVKPTTDTVMAFDDNPMSVEMQEILVKEHLPLSVKEFSVAVSQERTRQLGFVAEMHFRIILECR